MAYGAMEAWKTTAAKLVRTLVLLLWVSWELGLSSTLETISNGDEYLDKEAAQTSSSGRSSVGGSS